MKTGIVAFFLVIFSFHAFYQAGVVIWFHANRAYIASVLCENKSRPELKCNGNCQLNKKAMKAEEKDNKSLPSSMQKWVEISPCEIAGLHYDFWSANRQIAYTPRAPQNYFFQPEFSVFHPPAI